MPVHHSGAWALCRKSSCKHVGGLSRSYGERSQNLKFHNNPNTVGHLLPQLTPGTHWCYSWVGCFPSWHQATRFHLNSWVDWSNMSTFFAQGNNSNTKVATPGIKPGAFQLPGWCPNHFAILPQHTCIHTRTYIHAYINTYTYTRACTLTCINMHRYQWFTFLNTNFNKDWQQHP